MRCTLVGSYLFRLPLPHSSFLFISDRHLLPRRCARLSVIIYQLQRWKAFTDAHHCWSNVRSASTRCYQPKAIFPCLCKLLFIPSYVGCIQGTEKEMWNISCHKSLKHLYMGGKFSLKLKLVKVLDNPKPYSHVDILPPNVPVSLKHLNGWLDLFWHWMLREHSGDGKCNIMNKMNSYQCMNHVRSECWQRLTRFSMRHFFIIFACEPRSII